MSDFFTKKQRKFWCETCRIFIEYTHKMIEQHNRTNKHVQNLKRGQDYTNMKNKFQNHNKYLNQMEPDNNNSQFLNRKRVNNDNNISNVNTGNNDHLINEFKFEQVQKMVNEKTDKFIKRKNQKIWTVHFDEKYNLPYYYNTITQKSQWEKPEDLDTEESNIVDSAITKDSNKGSSGGVIGAWEIIEPSKNKTKTVIDTEDVRDNNNYGFIDKKTFAILENKDLIEDSLSDISEEENINKSNNKKKIKNYSINNKQEDLDSNIIANNTADKDRLVIKNQRLSQDNTIIFAQQLYDHQNISNNDEIKDGNTDKTININFKQKNKTTKRMNLIN